MELKNLVYDELKKMEIFNAVENLYDLLTVIPQLLAENGITVTLQDIGFFAL